MKIQIPIEEKIIGYAKNNTVYIGIEIINVKAKRKYGI